jgi:hypothetical protein
MNVLRSGGYFVTIAGSLATKVGRAAAVTLGCVRVVGRVA